MFQLRSKKDKVKAAIERFDTARLNLKEGEDNDQPEQLFKGKKDIENKIDNLLEKINSEN